MKSQLFLFILLGLFLTQSSNGIANNISRNLNQPFFSAGMEKLLVHSKRNHVPVMNRASEIRKSVVRSENNQSSLRSIVFQSFDEESQIWKNDFRQTYTFVNDTPEKEIFTDYFIGSEFVPYIKTVLYYDEYWRETEQLIYSWEENSETWEISEKSINLYNANNHITLNATLAWNDNALKWDTLSGNRIDFIYNDLEQQIQQTSFYFDYFQSKWLPINQIDFEYDPQGRCAQIALKYWDDFTEDFLPEVKEEYSFNNDNEWEEVLIYGWDEEWIPVSKITDLSWFSFENRQFSSYLKWDADLWMAGDSWEMSYKGTFTYHPELKTLLEAYEEYYDIFEESWVPSFKESNLYNEYLMLSKTTQEIFEFDSWHIIFGQIFNGTFDQFGRPIEIETNVYDTDSGIWTKWMKMIFEFENITAIEAPADKTQIAVVFPNPASQMFSVSAAENDLQITVYNIAGSLIFQDNISANEVSMKNIDITSWPSGLYLVKVMGKNTDKVVKLIKN